mmetsp:Transcript_20189/g.44011  ORF Transcript_20189/g.44011 Transcript_20189/m.44011 type:complete len:205 (+) Transcript_20189:444-1058(+)
MVGHNLNCGYTGLAGAPAGFPGTILAQQGAISYGDKNSPEVSSIPYPGCVSAKLPQLLSHLLSPGLRHYPMVHVHIQAAPPVRGLQHCNGSWNIQHRSSFAAVVSAGPAHEAADISHVQLHGRSYSSYTPTSHNQTIPFQASDAATAAVRPQQASHEVGAVATLPSNMPGPAEAAEAAVKSGTCSSCCSTECSSSNTVVPEPAA